MNFEQLNTKRGRKSYKVATLQGRTPFILLHEFEFFFDFLEGFRRKTAFAIGEEFCADVGAFGPGPEIIFFLLGGIGLLEGKPGAVDFEPFSEKVATAQARDISADFAEARRAIFQFS